MICFVQQHCIFCRIARGQETNKILYEVSQIQRESTRSSNTTFYRMCVWGFLLICSINLTCCTLLQDDQYVAFNDIRPAAKQHILVITKAHIDSILALRPSLEDANIGAFTSHVCSTAMRKWEICPSTM